MTQGVKTPTEEIENELKATNGNVSATARNLKLNPDTVFNRISKEEHLQEVRDNGRERKVDKAEDVMDEFLDIEGVHMIKFLTAKYILSTLGKNRGYTERQEVDVSGMTVIVRQRDAKL